MDKLYGIIRGCPLGIHDLSGTTLNPITAATIQHAA